MNHNFDFSLRLCALALNFYFFCNGQQDVAHNTRCFFTAKNAKDAKFLNFLALSAPWRLCIIILTTTNFYFFQESQA